MSASLVFDETIEICDPDGHVSDAPYWFETLADGASFGDPQPIEVIVASLIRYGAIVTTTGDENREPTFLIRVCGTDSNSLNQGIQALHAATRKQTTLVWTPPDGYSDPLAWEVQTSHLVEANGFDDLALVLRNQQVFRLQIKALPYRRGTTLIVDDAGTPPLSGGTLLYNCESTTGWASWGTPGTYAVDSVIFTEGAGSVRSQAPSANITTGSHLWYFYWVAFFTDQVTGLSLDTDTGGYLSLAVRVEYADIIPGGPESGPYGFWMQIDGVWEEVTSFVAARRDDADFVHYVWPVDADLTITGLRTQVRQVKSDNSGSATDGFPHRPYTWYDDVELLPAATTDHQIVKQLTVQGSAPTPAALRVAAPSELVPLGNVLAITVPTAEIPAGFQPDGRRWEVQGGTTPDATALHGSYFTPDTDYSDATGTPARPIFDVPVSMLTAGPYAMVGLVKAEASSLNFGVRAQLQIDGTDVGPTSDAEVTPQGLTTGWQFVVAGVVYLPPLPMQGADSTAKVRLLFKGAKMADVYFIPAWDSNGWPVADFSIVDCGSGAVEAGGASSSLWLDSPSPTQPQGGIWRGPSQDRLNAQAALPDAKFPGVHLFKAGGLTAFLVSTGAAGPTLRLEYYPRVL